MLEALHWRYATKKFNPNHKLKSDEIEFLTEILRLSPSSYGLQPWNFIVISNEELKQKLLPHSFGNAQILDCSHLIVFCTPLKYGDKEIECALDDHEAQGQANLRSHEKGMKQFLGSQNSHENQQWMAEQVHIALGVLLTGAAIQKIDACPIGGFSRPEYSRILGLKDRGLQPVVLCALGFRSEDDKNARAKKTRFDKKQTFEFIN